MLVTSFSVSIKGWPTYQTDSSAWSSIEEVLAAREGTLRIQLLSTLKETLLKSKSDSQNINVKETLLKSKSDPTTGHT